ncbi:MAG: DUF3858 domain-containing protein, partial [Candidatus Omnitrophica bacterium]|nr:DUF3858 domain-containing protein [Candidatus Omnitrophota bacterium]
PLFPPENNYSHLSMQIKINKDGGIYAKRKVSSGGTIEQSQRYWLKFTKPKLIEEVLKGTAGGVAAGARLVKYKIENATSLDKDVILEYEFQAPEFLTRAGKSRLVPQLGDIGISSVIKEERDYPLEYSIGGETTRKVVIEIPPDFSVKYLPQDIKVNSPWIDFENIYTKNNSTVSFYERYRLKKTIIAKDEYKQYKDLLEDIARKTNQNIILEEK